MNISTDEKIALWNTYASGNMNAVAEASGDTKLERMGTVVGENVDTVIDMLTGSEPVTVERVKIAPAKDVNAMRKRVWRQAKWGYRLAVYLITLMTQKMMIEPKQTQEPAS